MLFVSSEMVHVEWHATGRPDPALWVTAPLLLHTQLAGTKEQSSMAEMQAKVRGFLGRLYPQGT